ncbi:uncharacterized protein LOC143656874 [Tamandua tetradactyla]|uniref:uncharacterized protein LOC143656874 n=1 Tax=Tamandua tetradactyla TaxID=48850 RepID=UPI004053BB3E
MQWAPRASGSDETLLSKSRIDASVRTKPLRPGLPLRDQLGQGRRSGAHSRAAVGLEPRGEARHRGKEEKKDSSAALARGWGAPSSLGGLPPAPPHPRPSQEPLRALTPECPAGPPPALRSCAQGRGLESVSTWGLARRALQSGLDSQARVSRGWPPFRLTRGVRQRRCPSCRRRRATAVSAEPRKSPDSGPRAAPRAARPRLPDDPYVSREAPGPAVSGSSSGRWRYRQRLAPSASHANACGSESFPKKVPGTRTLVTARERTPRPPRTPGARPAETDGDPLRPRGELPPAAAAPRRAERATYPQTSEDRRGGPREKQVFTLHQISGDRESHAASIPKSPQGILQVVERKAQSSSQAHLELSAQIMSQPFLPMCFQGQKSIRLQDVEAKVHCGVTCSWAISTDRVTKV